MKKTEEAKLRAQLAKKKKGEQKGFTSWSFSRWTDYSQCPLKAKLKHIGVQNAEGRYEKVDEPPSPPMRRGSVIGKLGEIYITGKVRLEPKDWADFEGHFDESRKFLVRLTNAVAKGMLPDELSKFKKTFAEMRALYKKAPQRMVVEDSWAMRKDWSKTVFNDWDGCAVRIKVDCGNLVSKTKMVIRDWKTGKYRPEKVEEYVVQLELYALGALQLNPEVEEVECFLCFLDPGIMYPEPDSDEARRLTFTRADLLRLKKTWDKRTRAMLLDRAFAPRPNDKCSWCWYRKDNSANLPGGRQLCRY